jgi:hypothetical protein
MNRDSSAPRFGRAVLIAPLSMPLTVTLGLAVRALVGTRRGLDGTNPVAAVVLLPAILLMYGAPLAYGATLLILWPAGALLRDTRAFTWWSLTLIGMVAGGLLFPAYLHAIDPRGTWDFFPGAGFAAGAVTGWCFWFIAAGRSPRTTDAR